MAQPDFTNPLMLLDIGQTGTLEYAAEQAQKSDSLHTWSDSTVLIEGFCDPSSSKQVIKTKCQMNLQKRSSTVQFHSNVQGNNLYS